jgi:putative oxidoreductase
MTDLALPAPINRARTTLLQLSTRLDWVPPLLARLAVGLIFLRSGWGKLHNLDRVAKFFESLGIPAPGANAAMVGSIELICGALLLIGLITRLASLPLIPTMIVALLTAKRSDITGVGDLFGQQEWLFIVLLIWLALAGAGGASADRLLFGKSRADR